MLPFVYLKSLERHDELYCLKFSLEVMEKIMKKQGDTVLLIEICVHLNDCDPGNLERTQERQN